MTTPDDHDDSPLRIVIGKHVALRPAQSLRATRPNVVPNAEPQIVLTEDQRAEAIKHIVEPNRAPLPEPKSKKRGKPRRKLPTSLPTTDLLKRCREHMQRATYPKTARQLVLLWERDWRGQDSQPKNTRKPSRPGNIDRVSKWLERHERAGRLRVVDQKGRWNARRYLQVPGADWRRGAGQQSHGTG